MALQEFLRRWGPRILLSFASALSVSATAFVCAWYEYRNAAPFKMAGGPRDPTLWQFANEMDTRGIAVTCLLAGALTFPLCLINSTQLGDKRSSLLPVLIANTVTAIFAIFIAVVMAALHLPSGH